MTEGQRLLQVIADVEWVVGSFVGTSQGELLQYSMPPEFSEAQLRRTALRLANVVRCAELCKLQVDRCDFGLNRYQLVMQRRGDTMLVVMVEAPVNRRALRTAMQLVMQSLAKQTGAAAEPEGSALEELSSLESRDPAGSEFSD